MDPKRKKTSRNPAAEAKGDTAPPAKGDKQAVLDTLPAADSPSGDSRPVKKGKLLRVFGKGGGEEPIEGREGSSDGQKSHRRKSLLFGIPVLILLLASGLLSHKFGLHSVLFGLKATPKLEPVTSIKRPIPLPDYREMLDFLLLFEVEGQKMVTALRMEIGYQSPTRYQNFKDQTVFFRDTVYAFLLKQNLPRHSVKSWHPVVEKDLLEYLRAQLPQSQADSIRLTQVENL